MGGDLNACIIVQESQLNGFSVFVNDIFLTY